MKNHYKVAGIIFLFFLIFFSGPGKIQAQTSTISTGYTANNGSGLVTFNLQNTNPYPIQITEINCPIGAAGTIEAVFWMRPTPVSSTNPPGLIDWSNGWTLLDSFVSTPTYTNNTTPVVTFSKLASNIIIPANTTVGCGYGVWGSPGRTPGRQRYFSLTGAPTFSTAGVTLILGSAISMGYTSTTITSPIDLRAFAGSIQFKPYITIRPTNNASVTALVAPGTFCPGNQDVKVRIKNNGANIINNVTVQWTLDNVLQTPINWTSPLDTTGGTQFRNDTVITLGNVPFLTSRVLKVWTELPNSVPDTTNHDDTLTRTIYPALSGNYTIGGATPDFTTIASAVSTLNSSGVCGPVVFTVDPSTPPLSADITFNSIFGASATNTITFNGNGRTVTTATTNPTIRFNGASWITLDSLNITQTGATGFGIQISNASHHITIRKCSVTVSTTSTVTTIDGIVVTNGTYVADGNSTYITIDKNVITGGYANLTMVGSTGFANNFGHRITNNQFLGAYAYAMYISDADSMLISDNDISRLGRTNWTTGYGIRVGDSRYVKILRNRIHDMNSASAVYPIYLANVVNSLGYETEISNNMIYNTNSTSTLYGIYSLTTALTNVKIVHNTIQLNAASGTGAVRGAAFTVALTNVLFKNNIITLTGAGTGVKTGIYVTTTSTSFYSDNNVIYLSGGGTLNMGFWSVAQITLANWRTASSLDLNSVDIDPQFVNLPAGYLKTAALGVDNIGTPVGIATDIDGRIRSTTKPDPGAIEGYPPSLNNAGVTQIVLPQSFCAGSHPVKARVVNAGQNIINSVVVNWSVNGVAQLPVSWTNPIDTFGSLMGNDTLITLGTFSFSTTPATVVAFTTTPNSTIDTFTTNDSAQTIARTGLAGTYTVGPTGNYTTLTNAFTALTTQVCGPVVFELQSSYVSSGETFPLTIPAGASATDSVIIRPQTGATGLVISGNNATAILDLNGADYVTIDGRPGGTGINSELSISNASATGATIRFVNSATNNRLRYLNITGNTTSTTNGVVFFSNVSTGNIGNSNNTISDCSINGNSASVNCIYSSGSATPADNQNVSINNCNIYDFFSNVAATDVSGIALAGGSSNWSINGNRFYQTAIRNSTSTPALTNAVAFKAIYINSATVGGCSITNNVIGGSIAGIPSSVFVLGDATTATGITARLIDNNVSSATTANSIQGNTIANISLSSTVTNAFIGIHGRQGIVNIGNISGNTIGSQTGTGSIMMYHNGTATNTNVYAIRIEAASGLVRNNLIGSMSAETRSTGAQQLLAVYGTGTLPAALTISQNIVGGTTAHSLQSTSTSVGSCNVMGIVLSGATANLVTIDNNTVRNLSNLNTSAATTNGVKGIYLTGAATAGSVISNNTVTKLYSLSANPSVDQSSAVLGINNTNSSGSHLISNNLVFDLHADAASAVVNVTGILVNGTTTSTNNLIERNRIYALRGNASNATTTISGINMGAAITTGKYTLANNMVSLGRDTGGATLATGQQTTGILKQAGLASIFHNSVSIGGSGVDNTINNTFAYRSLANSAGDSTYNNVFVNARTNLSGGGTHYAASFVNATNIATDYNMFYTPSAPVAVFNGANQATLNDLKSASGKDVNSTSLAINFVSHADLHLTGASIGQVLLAGTPLATVTTDYDNATRSNTFPYMGADEGSIPLPVSLTTFSAVKSGNDVMLNWATANEVNNHYFEVQRSTDNLNFEPVGQVKGVGNSSHTSHYDFNDLNAFANYKGLLYYRLKQVDFEGTSVLSNVVSVSSEKAALSSIVVPNPFHTFPVLSVADATAGTKAVITIYNISGKAESTRELMLEKGNNTISLEEMKNMKPGLYFLNITVGSETSVQRMLKF